MQGTRPRPRRLYVYEGNGRVGMGSRNTTVYSRDEDEALDSTSSFNVMQKSDNPGACQRESYQVSC